MEEIEIPSFGRPLWCDVCEEEMFGEAWQCEGCKDWTVYSSCWSKIDWEDGTDPHRECAGDLVAIEMPV